MSIKISLKNALKLTSGYIFRWTGFSVEPDLYKVGHPTENSPVFLTCNFNLTVKRVLKALKNLDCYLLVAPSNGINVWCGACGDDFTTDSVISILKTSGIADLVSHRDLIVPQLSAPGIDPLIIKKKMGWNVKFGPVDIRDIHEYLENKYQKSEKMRQIQFTIPKRLEMGNVYFGTLMVFFIPCFFLISWFGFHTIDGWLLLDLIVVFIVSIYGPLLVLPDINPQKPGKIKLLAFGAIELVLIILISILLLKNTSYLAWNICFSILLTLVLLEDFNGLTPTSKSELGEKTWKKGEDKMKFLGMSFKLQPYGVIVLNRDECIGCKVCIDVCPRNLYIYSEADNKVTLENPQRCINCNACVKRCLGNCLNILEQS